MKKIMLLALLVTGITAGATTGNNSIKDKNMETLELTQE